MRTIPVDEIQGFPHRFDIFATQPAFSRKLFAAGLYPPLPVCRGELIWGFHILRTAGAAGTPELTCTDIDECGIATLLLALELENRTGDYSWEEQHSIALLAAELEPGGEASDPLSLAASGDRGFLSRISRYSSLPPHLKDLVNIGTLDIKTAERIVTLPAEVCEAVVRSGLFSFSKLRIFLVSLFEIGMRDSLSSEDLHELAGKLLSVEDPPAEIFKIKNPGLTKLTESFETIKSKHLADTGVSLEAPRYFEGDTFKLSFTFSARKELERKIEAIARLKGSYDELEELL